jgi:hypothetical protein
VKQDARASADVNSFASSLRSYNEREVPERPGAAGPLRAFREVVGACLGPHFMVHAMATEFPGEPVPPFNSSGLNDHANS